MRIMSTLTVLAILATVPFASHAQSAPSDDHNAHHPAQAQAAPTAPGSMDMKGNAGGGMMGGMPLKHVEGRLAFLKTELKSMPAQEPQWTKFAGTVCSTAKNAQGAMPPIMKGGAPAATALDLLGRYEKTLSSRLETVRALKGAFDPLYSSFSDDQKKVGRQGRIHLGHSAVVVAPEKKRGARSGRRC